MRRRTNKRGERKCAWPIGVYGSRISGLENIASCPQIPNPKSLGQSIMLIKNAQLYKFRLVHMDTQNMHTAQIPKHKNIFEFFGHGCFIARSIIREAFEIATESAGF